MNKENTKGLTGKISPVFNNNGLHIIKSDKPLSIKDFETDFLKVAVPTRDNNVDDHFGHCAYYTIYIIQNGKITDKSELPAPEGCGCKSNIATELEKIGVNVMLAGNMGDGAKNKLESAGINVIRGCHGPVNDIITAFLNDSISDSGEGCSSHGEDHQCSH